MAELLKLHYPQLLEIYNCITTNNVSKKKDNWNTLNRKVFTKINLTLSNNTISQLANCQHGTIEKLLFSLLDQVNNDNYSSRVHEPEIEIIESGKKKFFFYSSQIKIENVFEKFLLFSSY